MNYKQELIQLLQDVNQWEDLKEKLSSLYNTSLENDNKKNTIAGKFFEYFTKYFFICHPVYGSEIINSWLFEEIPLDLKKKLNIDFTDHGIDLLLEDKNHTFIAVQCKFKNDESCKLGWSKDKLGNLFGFSSEIDNLFIFSNAAEIDIVSKTRSKNFCFLSIKDLIELDASFFENLRVFLLTNTKKEYQKAKPFEYQKKIILTVNSYFNNENRGKLILPCGTGKTLISLWIKERQNSKLTLFLVPSLNLIRQTKNEWVKNSNQPFEYIIVCSEMDIDNKEDSANINLYDLDSFVTSEPEKIKQFIKHETTNTRIIFSTYQSYQKIIDAYDESLPAIDLAICDEAHRTASIDSGVFSLIHQDFENIKICKRLYMTATPRVYSSTIKKNIEEAGSILFDMADEKIYGKEIYRMSFAEAINLGILVDYQIICLGVNDDNIHKMLKDNYYFDKNISFSDYVNNYAVKKIFSKYPITHAITFHSKVKQAESFSKRNEALCKDINSYFVSGKQTTNKRSLIINAFKSANKAIISNARCLTEGVDIPAVDAVFFCDPKNSKVDIVQAVGRVLRKDKNNNDKIGRIIIPLYFFKNEDVENEIDSSIFSNVIQIIRSLADQDERLQEEINSIAFRSGSGTLSSTRIKFYQESRLNDLLSFENIGKKLERSLFEEIITKNSLTWDLYYMELVEFLSHNNGTYPSKNDNKKLADWCSSQRVAYNKKNLREDRIEKLEQIKFSWNLHEDNWNENFQQLYTFFRKNRTWPRIRSKIGQEHSLAVWMQENDKIFRNGKMPLERYNKLISIGYRFENRNWFELFYKAKEEFNKLGCIQYQGGNYNWLKSQSKLYNNGQLSDEQKKALEEIDIQSILIGKRESWEKNYKSLEEYFKENGHLPSSKEKFGAKEIECGSWAIIQRRNYINGCMSEARKEKLESIGFIFDTKKADNDAWNEQFLELKKWMIENSTVPKVRKDNSLETKLARFISYNKNWYAGTTQNSNPFPDDRKKKLESIGIQFDFVKVRTESWEERFKELKTWLSIHDKYPNTRSRNRAEIKLAKWVATQRKEYSKSSLSKEYIQQLESIGFSWNPNDEKWNENYNKAKRQIEEYGKIPLKIDGGKNSIYTWYYTGQKTAFKENRLDEKKIKMLKDLGIDF